jgi:diguanylate cyclase (GGDEF)-like protein
MAVEYEEMLESILNGVDALITVCDPGTFDVLFLNEAIRKRFGIEGSGVGHKCYEILQHLDAPCPTCPHDKLSLDKSLTWEHTEAIAGAVLLKNAKLIKWPGDRIAHLEYAVDISELRKEQKRNSELRRKVDKIYFDPLTNIYNRRYFEEKTDEIIGQSHRRAGDSVGVMMVDIDFFKQYNDEYGHVKGDECLTRISQILQSSLSRKTDFVARYGGEEFVVVLPQITEAGLENMAKRILANVAAAGIEHKTKEGIVTVSVGAVVDSGKSKGELLEAADKMLYKAKHSGRNGFSM